MDNQPFPLPRQSRETDILAGDGGAVYGPFDFKIFDENDVVALIRRGSETAFSPVIVTVTKVSGLPFDDFTVTFDDELAPQDSYVIRASRLHERQVAITRGGAISGRELERELSKQATVIQELRRDAGYTIRVLPGEEAPSIELLPDNHIWMSKDGKMVDGGSIKAIDDARDQARDSAAAALNSEQAAAQHASDTASDRSVVASDRAAAALSAGSAANSADDAAGNAGQAAADKAIISGWRTQIEGWKDDVASDRNDVQDDKVTTALLADAAAISAAEAHDALDMLYQYGDFNSRYIGEHAANPTSWNSGSPLNPGTDPLITGLIYYNTDVEEYRTYSGTDWASGAGNTSDFARKSMNGSDYNAATFRANLDLYSTSQTLNLPAGRAAASAIDDADFVQVVVAGAWQKIAWATVKGLIKGFLGNSATRDVGTMMGTVADGGDARFADAREWIAEIVSQAEAEAGTETTPRKWTADLVRRAVLANASGIGVGQTWQDVKSSRVIGTTYQNTTGKPIMFVIDATSVATGRIIEVSHDGSAWLAVCILGAYEQASIIVPFSYYYRIAPGGGSIDKWMELR